MSTTDSSYSFVETPSLDKSSPSPREKYVIIGAGPVGALAAIYAAERGHDVEVYEFRNDLRDPSTVPLNFTKSINLSLSERGINAMRWSGRPDLLDKVMKQTIPMRGRMIHGRAKSGVFTEEAQDYDIHGRTNYACDRSDLNTCLLNALETMPNVQLFFNHKLVGADFKTKKAWLEVKLPGQPQKEIEITFDLCIGADGAFSATRYHMMKFTRMDYKQEYIDTLWCEFHIDPATAKNATHVGFNTKVAEASANDKLNGDPNFDNKFKISPHHLHIWPGRTHMFIAIPSLDGSFTCTLFMPASQFIELQASPNNLQPFFDKFFPGVTDLIHPAALRSSFDENPHLPLISIECSPYHFADAAVIVGDAAHAMVPFYGQGMNAGLESVRVLFQHLDTHSNRAIALSSYSSHRAPDASAINKLALDNYVEMRSSVTSRLYKWRKGLEEWLSVNFPALGWATKYSMVSFGNERYSEVVRKTERQTQIMKWVLYGALGMPFVGAAVWAGWRWRSFMGVTRKAAKTQAWFAWKRPDWL